MLPTVNKYYPPIILFIAAIMRSCLAVGHVNRKLVVPLQIVTKAKGLLLGYLNKANVLF